MTPAPGDSAGAGARHPEGPLLVALDIDGTLISYDEVLSDVVRDAVGAVRDAGHEVVLSTGRSVVAIREVADALGLTDGYAVTSNGAVTVRLDQAEPQGFVLDDVVTFDPGPALRLLREQLPDARYAVEEIGVGFRLNTPFPDGELGGEHEVVPFEDLWEREVTRVVVRSPEHSSADFHDMVAGLGLDDITYAVGWTAWMDLAPLGVSKATALERLRRILHVQPHRTVALGDGFNDLEMLRWAARGVAMGHAAEQVRAAADEVTGSVDDDGAAELLRSLLA
ncbi:haloacid dehalogenase [Paraoerskovia sediminicola]|uniref:Haloacid dehalogenase n=1 Tax=Paraoerskovia sediminicola TaxID=1138587 RepID=A0ABN6XDZ9_9CELL|nr:HAD family hydrolase [Paraoerskovia sediminicola]BDZ42348.1 haloacid dehalogenase [Paraoerskovia sediminicola]